MDRDVFSNVESRREMEREVPADTAQSEGGRGKAELHLHGLGLPLPERTHETIRQHRPSEIVTSSYRVSRGNEEEEVSTASTFTSSTKATPATGFTPPTPFSSSQFWSPAASADFVKSATLPRKSTWDNLTQQTSRQNIHSTFTSNYPLSRDLNALESVKAKPVRGLGVQLNQPTSASPNLNPSQRGSQAVAAVAHSLDQVDRSYLRPLSFAGGNHEIHKQQKMPGARMNTDPLLQNRFGNSRDPKNIFPHIQSEKAATHHTGDSDEKMSRNPDTFPNPPGNATVSKSGTLTKPQPMPGHVTPPSDGSDLVSISPDACTILTTPTQVSSVTALPESGGASSDFQSSDEPVLSFKWQRERDKLAYTEVVEGGLQALVQLNPDTWQMPHGSRVVCIKADFVENFHWSIQTGMWITIDKVGERVMRLWEGRQDAKEQIVLVFSVNGLKSYCGIAEMRGPWVRADESQIEHWLQTSEQRAKGHILGMMPVEWRFVKNVAYEHFRHIKHDHNGQPITNMWNGMHFPTDSGREVVNIYVNNTHFTNLLTRPVAWAYDPMKGVNRPTEIDPSLDTRFDPLSIWRNRPQMTETSHGRTSQRGRGIRGLPSNWRQRQPPGASARIQDVDVTPTPLNRMGVTKREKPVGVAHFDGQDSPTPPPRNLARRAVETKLHPVSEAPWLLNTRSGRTLEPPRCDVFSSGATQDELSRHSSVSTSVAPAFVNNPASNARITNLTNLSMEGKTASKYEWELGRPTSDDSRTSFPAFFDSAHPSPDMCQHSNPTAFPSVALPQTHRTWHHDSAKTENLQHAPRNNGVWQVASSVPPLPNGHNGGYFPFAKEQQAGLPVPKQGYRPNLPKPGTERGPYQSAIGAPKNHQDHLDWHVNDAADFQLLRQELEARKKHAEARKKAAEARKQDAEARKMEAEAAYLQAIAQMKDADDDELNTDSYLRSVDRQQFHRDLSISRSPDVFTVDSRVSATSRVASNRSLTEKSMSNSPSAFATNTRAWASGSKETSPLLLENADLKALVRHFIGRVHDGNPRSSQEIKNAVHDLLNVNPIVEPDNAGRAVGSKSRSDIRSRSNGRYSARAQEDVFANHMHYQ